MTARRLAGFPLLIQLTLLVQSLMPEKGCRVLEDRRRLLADVGKDLILGRALRFSGVCRCRLMRTRVLLGTSVTKSIAYSSI